MKTILLYSLIATFLISCGGSSGSNESSVESSSSSSSSSSSLSTSATSSSTASNSSSSSGPFFAKASLYGLYVFPGLRQADGLLGDSAKEQVFLDFVRDNGFNYLIFYDLNNLVASSAKANQLASLISRAKSDYGVHQVGAALGSEAGADVIVAYNKAHRPEERIDVLNVEYEFWNRADRTSAFSHTLDILDAFQTAAQEHDLETEIYIGWISEGEALQLANAADRILVHFYRQTDVNIINYGLERLQYLAGANSDVRIAPIFSSEGPENTNDLPFMGDWLQTHPNEQAFRSWVKGYHALEADWKMNLDLMGAVWFIYGKFLDVNVDAPNHITLHPEDRMVCVGDTVSFSVTSYASEPRFYWMKDGDYLNNGGKWSGADTATLTVSDVDSGDAGGYYARVVSRDASNPTSFSSSQASLVVDKTCGG